MLLIKNCLLRTVRPGTGASAWLGSTTRKPMTACHTAGYSDVFSCIRLVKSCAGSCHFVMKSKKTAMVISYRNSAIKTRLMQIRRGIFQSYSISPLLFCMALNTLSEKLCRTCYSYWMSTGHGETAKRQLVSHLLYTDDLKLCGRNPDQLKGLLHMVHTFSDDIQTKLSLDKCAVCCTLCQQQAF